MSLDSALSVLDYLSSRNRRIVTPWRVMLALKERYPHDQLERQARQITKFLERHHLVRSIEGTNGYYLVTAPYVAAKEVNPYEVLMESYFDGALAYSTAMMLHRLTDQRFNTLHVLLPDERNTGFQPLDTDLTDWDVIACPVPSRIREFANYSVSVHKTKKDRTFGYEVIRPEGFSIRLTDLERTLIDGLRFPKHCGGLDEVFRAWVRAYDLINVDKVIQYTEQLEVGILFQRVGFVLEVLGFKHERFDVWQTEHAQRGGSRVINPEKPFKGDSISERWLLSINHPVSILEEMDASYS